VKRFLRNNGLSLVLFGVFLIILVGQSLVGHQNYNNQQQEHGQPSVTYREYLSGNNFLEATMENWESEFFQMFFFIILTVFLYQKGSAESKDPDREEDVDRDPAKSPTRKNAPWAVRQGGWILKIYAHSLSLAFFLLFLISFVLHAAGGAGEYNDDQQAHGRPERVTTWQYMTTARFWFESLQNWQSEFLAVGSMVVLTIFLRERGSMESKPVDEPDRETG
jgi:hypothetical protein